MTWSEFQIEEPDIVKLVPARDDDKAAAGWINVGVHALFISLDSDGNLRVESFARTNEDAVLGAFTIPKEYARNHRGVDPDEET